MQSWISADPDSDFPLHNIPFGIFHSKDNSQPRACSIIGDTLLDLAELARLGYLKDTGIKEETFRQPNLNAFFALGRSHITSVRNALISLFSEDNPLLRDREKDRRATCIPVQQTTAHMPFHVPNYTDFYSSMEHATNVGKMFRDPANALLPNWKHLPVGYHGRASSIVLSGTDIHRPKGQFKADDDALPSFGPCKLLDFELEMAFVTCGSNPLGTSISTEKAPEYIAGFLLFNDWSARDIQKWEYVPLGPFLSKNFASSVSPWVVTLDALEPFRVAGPKQDPPVLPYLQYKGDWNYDISLEVWIRPPGGKASRVCTSNFKYMYWNICQQLAHHTVNGCNIQVGDLYGSGTISGPEEGTYGSMLELTWRGSKPITLDDGSQRKFIQDGDTVIMKGMAEKNGIRIGLGEVHTTILPATV